MSTNIKLIESAKTRIPAGGLIHVSEVTVLEAIDEACSGVYHGNT